MELIKKHRIALLNELDKAKEDLERNRICLNSENIEDIKEHFEISMFLAQERDNLIEKSLIDNEIDF